MNRRQTTQLSKTLALVVLAAGSLATVTAGPVAAECTGYDAWPPFEHFAVGRADQVLVGDVTEAIRSDSSDAVIAFRFRVEDALVGPDPGEVAFQPIVGSNADCAPTLIVRVGDRLAIALDHITGAVPIGRQVGVAAFLDRDPTKGAHADRMRGATQLTVAEVRSMFAPPETDSLALPKSQPSPGSAIIVALSAVLGGLVALSRLRGRRDIPRRTSDTP